MCGILFASQERLAAIMTKFQLGQIQIREVCGGMVIMTSLESQTIPPLSSLQASRVSNDAQIASARLEFLSVEINAANV